MPSGSGMAAVGHLYNPPNPSTNSVSFNTYPAPSRPGLVSTPNFNIQVRTTMDDMHLHRQPSHESAKRYRRRSVGTIGVADAVFIKEGVTSQGLRFLQHKSSAPVLGASSNYDKSDLRSSPPSVRPASPHTRSGSVESATSTHSSSRPSSVSCNNSEFQLSSSGQSQTRFISIGLISLTQWVLGQARTCNIHSIGNPRPIYQPTLFERH